MAEGDTTGVFQHSVFPYTISAYEAPGVKQSVPVCTISASAVALSMGNLIQNRPHPYAIISGQSGGLGNTIALVPVVTPQITGASGTSGSLLGLRPVPTLRAYALTVVRAESGEITAVAMCLDNSANTEYTAFDFNSLTVYNGLVFGTNETGIYLIGADTDDTAKINAKLETSLDDFGVTYVKEMAEVVIGVKGGPLTVQSRMKDGTFAPKQELVTSENVFKNRRARVPRGLHQRYWSTLIQNKNGADFQIDSIENNIVTYSRKVNE